MDTQVFPLQVALPTFLHFSLLFLNVCDAGLGFLDPFMSDVCVCVRDFLGKKSNCLYQLESERERFPAHSSPTKKNASCSIPGDLHLLLVCATKHG